MVQVLPVRHAKPNFRTALENMIPYQGDQNGREVLLDGTATPSARIVRSGGEGDGCILWFRAALGG